MLIEYFLSELTPYFNRLIRGIFIGLDRKTFFMNHLIKSSGLLYEDIYF